ncbi:MAG: hypothetical protein Athens041674_818, partial [Parcubacteria group bacterium Athens0416_74]
MMWLDYLHIGIEAVLALAACVALWQLKLTKDTSKLNSRRESIKYASELLSEYLIKYVPLNGATLNIKQRIDFKNYRGDLNFMRFTREELEIASSTLKKHAGYVHSLQQKHGDLMYALLD